MGISENGAWSRDQITDLIEKTTVTATVVEQIKVTISEHGRKLEAIDKRLVELPCTSRAKNFEDLSSVVKDIKLDIDSKMSFVKKVGLAVALMLLASAGVAQQSVIMEIVTKLLGG